MIIRVLARSSSGDEPYTATFVCGEGEGDEHVAWGLFCSCKAASIGQWCSHRRDLLKGDTKRLADPEQGALLKEALAWPESVEARRQLDVIEDELRVIEREKKALKDKETAVKRRLADVFDGPQPADEAD